MRFLYEKYELVRCLGRGGTSEVMLVRHRKFDTLRAVKAILKNQYNDRNYYVEINVLNTLNIKGIPMIYDVEEDKEYWYIVEEYIEGESFAEYLERDDADVWKSVRYMQEICRIIDSLNNALPQGIIYGDLKPENVLISMDEVYIVDFGNCILMDSDETAVMATRGYAAPEQINGERLGVWTDIYSIGVLLQRVYKRFSIELEGYKKDISRIVSVCVKKDVNKRYSSVKSIELQLVNLFNEKNNKCAFINEVYIYGSRRYAGTSHFAIGLCRYLDGLSVDSRLIENNCHSEIVGLASCIDNIGLVDGEFRYKGCRFIPDYGDFVECDNENKEIINIYDCGELSEKEYYESLGSGKRIILVIADIKEYKRLETFKWLRFDEGVKILYVGNFCTAKGLGELSERYNLKIRKMPYFDDPFLLEGYQKEFYGEIVKELFGIRLPRRRIFRNRVMKD